MYAFPSPSNVTLGSPETVTTPRAPLRGTSCSSQLFPPSEVEYTPHHASPCR